jgi:hypothetical protein
MTMSLPVSAHMRCPPPRWPRAPRRYTPPVYATRDGVAQRVQAAAPYAQRQLKRRDVFRCQRYAAYSAAFVTIYKEFDAAATPPPRHA